jgi:hypothetical protein
MIRHTTTSWHSSSSSISFNHQQPGKCLLPGEPTISLGASAGYSDSAIVTVTVAITLHGGTVPPCHRATPQLCHHMIEAVMTLLHKTSLWPFQAWVLRFLLFQKAEIISGNQFLSVKQFIYFSILICYF